MALQLIKALKGEVPALVTKAEQHAQAQIPSIAEKALNNMHQTLDQEYERLEALAAINPSVRQEELDFIKRQQTQLTEYIEKAQLTFEAIRLVVVTH